MERIKGYSHAGRGAGHKSIIKNKMRCLNDFGICSQNDAEMIAKLEKAIADSPDKDPRIVLDIYCRPMIQAKVNSWV